jgi:hypothetical protein
MKLLYIEFNIGIIIIDVTIANKPSKAPINEDGK